MSTRQLLFFATDTDLKNVITKIEAKINLLYYKAGLLSKNEIKCLLSLVNEKEVGIAEYGENNLCTSYIVISSAAVMNPGRVIQKNGEEKMAVDQRNNETSVSFRPGGLYKQGSAIIEGRVGTISGNKQSLEIYNLFARELKAGFTKAKGYLIGDEAAAYYRKGWRLTQSVNSPEEYDFQL